MGRVVQVQDLPLKSAPNEYCSSSASFVATTEVMVEDGGKFGGGIIIRRGGEVGKSLPIPALSV